MNTTQQKNINNPKTGLLIFNTDSLNFWYYTGSYWISICPPPVADAGDDVSICIGTSTTLNANGGVTYTWTPVTALSNPNIADPVANPAVTTTYKVTIDKGGCEATDDVLVTVKALPTANAGADQTICRGITATLTASGGTTYSWNTGATTATINVSPTTNTTYTVTATINGCTDDDQVVVKVNALPTADAGVDQTMCSGATVTLAASGGTTYLWNTGVTSSSFTISPASTVTYTVTATLNGCTDDDQVVITVNSSITANAGIDQPVCIGSAATLTASGGTTYFWSTGATTATINVSPVTNTTYSVTATSAGCTDDDQVVVTVYSVPTANAGIDQIICRGATATLTASGGTTNIWSTGGLKPAINVSPTSTTTYTVTAIDNNGCSDDDQVVVTVNSLPTANAGADQTICVGSAAMLTASGGTTYSWNVGVTTATIIVSPTAITTYTVTATDNNGCTDDDVVVVTVNPVPTANAGADQSICSGTTATLTASGGTTYLWNTGATTATINVTPSATITYTVTATDNNSCTDDDQVVVTVKALPTANAGADQTICIGSTATLTASGGTTYSWSTGATTATINVTPTATTTYTITATTNGCTDDDAVVVTVNPIPTANAGADQTICRGVTATLTASGGTTYSWSTGATTATINVTPTATITYTVTATDNNGCTDDDQVKITVNALPTANAGNDTMICDNNSAVLTATGGVSYLWSISETTASITVNPPVITFYTVTVTNANGCTDSDDVTVNVIASPTVDVSPPSVSICAGLPVTFNADVVDPGACTFLWSEGSINQNILVSPTTSTTYTVTVSYVNGCTDSDYGEVTVWALPTANAGADQSICFGSTATLTVSGSGGTPPYNYGWNTGETTASITVSPGATKTYMVSVYDSHGCIGTDDVKVTVNATPTANAGADKTICIGSTGVIAAAVAGGTPPYTYAWSTGETTMIINISPTATTTYTITITDINSCSDDDQVVVAVGALPTANAGSDRTVCSGSSTTLGGSPTASGGTSPYTYSWASSPAGFGSALANPTANPAVNTTYTVTVTDINNCQGSDYVAVAVYALPTANAGADQSICKGATATLTASGGISYSWSTGATTATINVSPTTTTTYTVTATDGNGCTDDDQVKVTVNALPTANAGADQSICAGTTATLTASGGTSYAWNIGETTAAITVSPGATTTYTVTATDANGCTDDDQVVVTIKALPTANAGADQTICRGSTATLTASGGTTYSWSTGQTTVTINVTPTATTTYTVTATTNGCTDDDQVVVTINPVPTANAGSDRTICNGMSTTLGGSPTASGGTGPYTYSWASNPAGFGSALANPSANPTVTTTYTVTVTDNNGCRGTDNVKVTVNAAMVANAGADWTVCFSGSTTLTGSAAGGTPAYTYVWSTGGTTQSIVVGPTATTTYTVTVSDVYSCTDDDQVVITAMYPTWSCGSLFTDPRDSKNYQTVLITDPNPDQCWFKQNINVGVKIPGASGMSNNGQIDKYCWDDIEANCTSNGGLYQWNEAVQYYGSSRPDPAVTRQGICPVCWHIPSESEWHTLELALTSGECDEPRTGLECDPAGERLKKTGLVPPFCDVEALPCGNTGFEAIPAGFRDDSPPYFDPVDLDEAYFWTSTDQDVNGGDIFARYIYDYNVGLGEKSSDFRWNQSNPEGYSVRCLKGFGTNP